MGSRRVAQEAFGSSFASLLLKSVFYKKRQFPWKKTMIFQGPGGLGAVISRSQKMQKRSPEFFGTLPDASFDSEAF